MFTIEMRAPHDILKRPLCPCSNFLGAKILNSVKPICEKYSLMFQHKATVSIKIAPWTSTFKVEVQGAIFLETVAIY